MNGAFAAIYRFGGKVQRMIDPSARRGRIDGTSLYCGSTRRSVLHPDAMKTLTIIVRCTIGCALGACLGGASIVAGRIEEGIGLAMIGGCLGMILAISKVLYKTSSAETFSRGLLLFLKLTAAKNISGGGQAVGWSILARQGSGNRSMNLCST